MPIGDAKAVGLLVLSRAVAAQQRETVAASVPIECHIPAQAFVSALQACGFVDDGSTAVVASYSLRISLGALLVQRWNARLKFAASLKPSANAISSLASVVLRRYFRAIWVRNSSRRPRKEKPC